MCDRATPQRIAGRKAQDVDGKEGYFGRYGDDPTPELETRGQAVHLFWQYAPGAWADALADSKAHALALAKHGPASVTWGSGRDVEVGDNISVEGTEIGGRTWQFGDSNGVLEARLTDTKLPVTVSGRVGMSVAELKTYVARLRFAPDLGDRATWFPASDLRTPR